MFEKVLVAEDHESSSISVRKALEDLGINKADYVFYCDDALARVQAASKTEQPYDLLITDLSFEEDGTAQHIRSGAELIKAIRSIQPRLNILVFSVENKPTIIDSLYKDLQVNAFVRKARRDVSELKIALQTMYTGRNYKNPQLRQSINNANAYEFKEYDIILIRLLSEGMLQKQIPDYLQAKDIKPSGLSSVEKRLNTIREALNFTKNEQLVAFCKDMGVI